MAIGDDAAKENIMYKVEGWHPCGLLVESNEVTGL